MRPQRVLPRSCARLGCAGLTGRAPGGPRLPHAGPGLSRGLGRSPRSGAGIAAGSLPSPAGRWVCPSFPRPRTRRSSGAPSPQGRPQPRAPAGFPGGGQIPKVLPRGLGGISQGVGDFSSGARAAGPPGGGLGPGAAPERSAPSSPPPPPGGARAGAAGGAMTGLPPDRGNRRPPQNRLQKAIRGKTL